MHIHLTESLGKRLLIGGGIVFLVSQIVNFVILMSLYSKSGQCFDKVSACEIDIESAASKACVALTIASVATIVAGLAIFIAARRHKTKQR